MLVLGPETIPGASESGYSEGSRRSTLPSSAQHRSASRTLEPGPPIGVGPWRALAT